MGADIAAVFASDLKAAMDELGQTFTINGGAAVQCVAHFPSEGRDLSEFGFDPTADCGFSVRDTDMDTLPSLGQVVVFLTVSYKITSIEDDGIGVGRDLSCVRLKTT